MRCLAVLLALFSATVLAWNEVSHEAVAYIAYQQLTPRTKERVNQLLKLNPYYDRWLQRPDLSADREKRDLEIFMLAANWPDEIKGDQTYISDGAVNGNVPPNEPEATQNIGYSDKRKHKYWHFIDVPFSTTSYRQFLEATARFIQQGIRDCQIGLLCFAGPRLL